MADSVDNLKLELWTMAAEMTRKIFASLILFHLRPDVMLKMSRSCTRLMTMSPFYPCGKPCSSGTHAKTVK